MGQGLHVDGPYLLQYREERVGRHKRQCKATTHRVAKGSVDYETRAAWSEWRKPKVPRMHRFGEAFETSGMLGPEHE